MVTGVGSVNGNNCLSMRLEALRSILRRFSIDVHSPHGESVITTPHDNKQWFPMLIWSLHMMKVPLRQVYLPMET
jgi:hypothetical protein